MLDGWSEYFHWQRWAEAFEEFNLDPAFYARRLRPQDEVFPWSHIETGVTEGYLKREYRRALTEEATGDCHDAPCLACGLHALVPQCEESLAKRSSSQT